MTSTSWKNELEYPTYPCKYCKGLGWKVGYYTDAGGAPKYPFVCVGCGKRTQHFAKRKAVEAAGVEPVPLSPMTMPFVCEVCNTSGAERHHWAPSSLFGSEADKWPTSYLCRACHERWHRTVTPSLNAN